MNSYDTSTNPFADQSVLSATKDDFNPFSQSQSEGAYEVLKDEPSTKSLKEDSYTSHITSSVSSASRDSLLLREQLLLKRERKVEEREREIAELEKKIREDSSSEANYNWPSKCWPLLYHDIEVEVPARQRTLVMKFYAHVLFTWVCFLSNWIGALSVWWSGVADADMDALWATVYFFCGLLGSWKFWYISLYNGCKEGLTRKWLWFFFWFFAHFCFVVIMIIGIKGFGGCGFFTFVTMFSQKHQFAGVFTLIVFILWSINCLVTVILIKLANSAYKERDATTDVVTDTRKEINKVVVDSVADSVRSSYEAEAKQRILQESRSYGS